MPAFTQSEQSSHSSPIPPASRPCSLSCDQNERKRSKEMQWFNAISYDDNKKSKSSKSSTKQQEREEAPRKRRSSKQADTTAIEQSLLSPKSKDRIAQAARSSSHRAGGSVDEKRDTSRLALKSSHITEMKHSSGGRSRTSRRRTSSSKIDGQGRHTMLPGARSTEYIESTSSKTSESLVPPSLSGSPSVLSVTSASTRVTTESNDSNSTITETPHQNQKSDHKSSNYPSQSFSEPTTKEKYKATVEDDTRSSEEDHHDAMAESSTISTASSVFSQVNSPRSPQTPSSRSSVPSSFAHRMPSQSSHWFDHTGHGESLTSHSASADVGASPLQTHLQNAEQRSMRTDDHSDRHGQLDEADRVRQSADNYSSSLQAQEEALYNRLTQIQNSQQFLGTPYRAYDPSTNVPRYPMYHQQGAIEHNATSQPDQSAYGLPQMSTNRPPVLTAPDAPDLSRTTLTGYELLASKLTEASATIRPAYRKFEVMHHRILLHIQDELCELEEQLRRLDEVVAQMASHDQGGNPLPASRRAEAYYGNEVHFGRTQLLGQIFIKLEQYHRALSAYSGVAESMDRPSEGDVARYRDWMAANHPVHQSEATFLRDDRDLVAIGRRRRLGSTTSQPSIVSLIFVPFLPLVAFSLVPTFLGRIFVTAMMAAGSWWYISETESRGLLGDRDWAMVVVAYLVLMAGIAGIVS